MTLEEHQPSPEELKIAESTMNDTEKMQSAASEKGYYDVIKEEAEKRGREAAQARQKEQKEKESFVKASEEIRIEKKVKGFYIIFDWDQSQECYVITFPQLKDDTVAYGKNIISPNIVLKHLKKGEASKIFAEALKDAETATNIYDLYSKASLLADDLIRNAH